MDNETFVMPRFQEALRQSPPQLPTDTFRRYAAGKLPKTFLRLLIARPDLARALMQDIEGQADISKSH